MGLTKEVREFFTGRIYKVLDAKVSELMKPVDAKKVEKTAVDMFCSKYSFDKNLMDRAQKNKQLKEQLEKDEQKLAYDMREALNASGANWGNYYCVNFSNVEARAIEMFKREVQDALYPNVMAQVEKVEAIKDDVTGCVLLATTEPKLVVSLTKLLENYGGDIKELLALIPKQQ